jgi:hypothetical protein
LEKTNNTPRTKDYIFFLFQGHFSISPVHKNKEKDPNTLLNKATFDLMEGGIVILLL